MLRYSDLKSSYTGTRTPQSSAHSNPQVWNPATLCGLVVKAVMRASVVPTVKASVMFDGRGWASVSTTQLLFLLITERAYVPPIKP